LCFEHLCSVYSVAETHCIPGNSMHLDPQRKSDEAEIFL